MSIRRMIWLLALVVPWLAWAQAPPTWTLPLAREQALTRSTLAAQSAAVDQVTASRLAASRSQQLPQAGLTGQATWQSTAVAIPRVVTVPQEQFRTEVEVSQLLYDGGRLRSDRAVTAAQQQLERARIGEQREQVLRRTDRLFFEALLGEAQVQVRQRGIHTLQAQQALVAAQVREGVALPAALDELAAAVLRQEQDLIEAQARHGAVRQQLALWLGVDAAALGQLTVPDSTPVDSLPSSLGVRPELAALAAQGTLLARQQSRTLAERGPRVDLYATGGYGQPNPLNFTIVNPDFYFVGGVRLRWTLWNNQRTRHEAATLAAQQAQVTAQAEERRRSLALELAQPLALVDAYNALLRTDAEIIRRRRQVVESTRRRLQEGTATVNDFVADVNDLQQADINQEVHRILRLQAETELRLLAGEALTQPDPTDR